MLIIKSLFDRKHFFCLISNILIITFSGFSHGSILVTGLAYEPETKTIKYSEQHYYSSSSHKVIYREADGNIFAEKTINYQANSTRPSLRQVNTRNGEVIDISNIDDKVIHLTYKENDSALTIDEALESTADIVIDAGFDMFIKENWSALKQGNTLYFDYLVPSRQSTVKLRARAESCKQVATICMEVSGAALLARLFIEPIHLQYQEDTRQLMRFTGKSNIATAEGKYEVVDIHYKVEESL